MLFFVSLPYLVDLYIYTSLLLCFCVSHVNQYYPVFMSCNLSPNLYQCDLEDEGGVPRDLGGRAVTTIGPLWGDGQLAFRTHLHAHHADVPPLNYVALAQSAEVI